MKTFSARPSGSHDSRPRAWTLGEGHRRPPDPFLLVRDHYCPPVGLTNPNVMCSLITALQAMLSSPLFRTIFTRQQPLLRGESDRRERLQRLVSLANHLTRKGRAPAELTRVFASIFPRELMRGEGDVIEPINWLNRIVFSPFPWSDETLKGQLEEELLWSASRDESFQHAPPCRVPDLEQHQYPAPEDDQQFFLRIPGGRTRFCSWGVSMEQFLRLHMDTSGFTDANRLGPNWLTSWVLDESSLVNSWASMEVVRTRLVAREMLHVRHAGSANPGRPVRLRTLFDNSFSQDTAIGYYPPTGWISFFVGQREGERDLPRYVRFSLESPLARRMTRPGLGTQGCSVSKATSLLPLVCVFHVGDGRESGGHWMAVLNVCGHTPYLVDDHWVQKLNGETVLPEGCRLTETERRGKELILRTSQVLLLVQNQFHSLPGEIVHENERTYLAEKETIEEWQRENRHQVEVVP